jgi:SAM-dependent methyltransferase
MIPDSLERIVPDLIAADDAAAQKTLQLHLERYRFAAKHVQPGRLLDIACGVGYGSYLLHSEHPSIITGIIAVDNDEEAIAYAKKRYASPLIEFIKKDAMNFTDAAGFQTIVCLETIEHLLQPESFLEKLYSMLLTGGILIISAPVTPSKDANPYHVNEFTAAFFRKMLNRYSWKEINSLLQVQPFSLKELQKKKTGQRKIRKNLTGYYLQHPLAVFRRLKSLLSDGLKNKYLTVVLKKNCRLSAVIFFFAEILFPLPPSPQLHIFLHH